MATEMMRRRQKEEERPGEDDIDSTPPETDWRRMTDVAHDHIALRAYELYEERGREPGHEMEDWLKAQHDIEERNSTNPSSDQR